LGVDAIVQERVGSDAPSALAPSATTFRRPRRLRRRPALLLHRTLG